MNDYLHMIALCINGNIAIYNFRKCVPVFQRALDSQRRQFSCLKLVDRE